MSLGTGPRADGANPGCVEVESPLVAIGGAPEDGQADLAVLEIEAVLAARGDADRGRLAGRSPLDDEPPAVDVLLPVRGTTDRSARDLGEEACGEERDVGTLSFSRRRSSFQVTRKRNSRTGQDG